MDNAGRILTIDDELQIRRILRVTLEAHGYAVIEAAHGKQGIYLAATEKPDIVLLDLGLPDMDGLEVLRSIREWSTIPIIILSVRNEEDGKVAALEAGADDYVSKPFSVKELLARIRAALRRSVTSPVEPTELRNGSLLVDLMRHVVKVADTEVRLTATEYALLSLLIRNQDKLLTHNHIIRDLWGPLASGGAQRLRVHMAQLRKKIEYTPRSEKLITTEPGVGYRMVTSHGRSA